MVECIRDQPWEEIIEKTREPDTKFQIRVDREAEFPVVPDDPRSLLVRGEFNLVPWMHGLVQEEAALFVPLLFGNKTVLSALFAGEPSAWGQTVDLATENQSGL